MKVKVIRGIKATFVDERGEITNILEEPVNHIALITSKKGFIRANHYHPKQIQYDYLLKGRYKFYVKDIKDKKGKMESIISNPGYLIITRPNVAHAMKFLKDSIFFTFTTGHRYSSGYKNHTVKFKLI